MPKLPQMYRVKVSNTSSCLRKYEEVNRCCNVECTLKCHFSQLIATAVIFVANLGNGIFMGPRSTAIMFEKHKMEKETDGESNSLHGS